MKGVKQPAPQFSCDTVFKTLMGFYFGLSNYERLNNLQMRR